MSKNSIVKQWGCEKSGVEMLHFPQPVVYTITFLVFDSQKSILPLTP